MGELTLNETDQKRDDLTNVIVEKMFPKRGRPRFYTDEERRQRKTDYMLHKPWYCDICKNGKNYSLAGKHNHLRTLKHFKNANEQN